MQFLLLMVGAIVFSTLPLFAMDKNREDDNSSFLLFPFSEGDFSEKENQKPFPVQRQITVRPILSQPPPDQPEDQLPPHFIRSAPMPFSSAQLQQRDANYVWDD